MQNTEMKEKLVNYFTALCDHYRPSHKEIAVSNYLLKWFQDLQKKNPEIKIETLQTIKTNDLEGFNIKVDVPATKGYENAPCTMLQSHMDMVWVTRDGHAKDEKVEWYIEDDKLKAKYSSLGADDGTGIAIMQYIVKDSTAPHGPLRLLLTTDEECDMTGAAKLPASWSQGCKYCINIDGEVAGEAFVMSAGVGYSKGLIEVKTEEKTSEYSTPLFINLSGGYGGHSGNEIARNVKDITKDQGRANCLWWVNKMLLKALEKNIDFKLGIISHGKVYVEENNVFTNDNKMNAIPNNGEAVVFLKNKEDVKAFEDAVNETYKELKKWHHQEDKINLEVSTGRMPDYFQTLKFINDNDRNKLLTLINSIPQGVFEMSDTPDVPKATSIVVLNFKFDKTKNFIDYTVIATPRSCYQKTLDELKNKVRTAFKNAGLKEEMDDNAIEFKEKNSFMIRQVAQPWSVDPKANICKLCVEAWAKQSDKPMELKSVHGGLECAYFFTANPELEIISVGPTIYDCHSVNETLYLNTFAPAAQMIIDVLEAIAKQ